MKRFETHGSIDWCEFLTRDVEAAVKFYSEVLGWDLKNMPMDDGGPYYVIEVEGEEIGGIMKMPPWYLSMCQPTGDFILQLTVLRK